MPSSRSQQAPVEWDEFFGPPVVKGSVPDGHAWEGMKGKNVAELRPKHSVVPAPAPIAHVTQPGHHPHQQFPPPTASTTTGGSNNGGGGGAPPPQYPVGTQFAGVSISDGAPAAYTFDSNALKPVVGDMVQVQTGAIGVVKFVTSQPPPYFASQCVVKKVEGYTATTGGTSAGTGPQAAKEPSEYSAAVGGASPVAAEKVEGQQEVTTPSSQHEGGGSEADSQTPLLDQQSGDGMAARERRAEVENSGGDNNKNQGDGRAVTAREISVNIAEQQQQQQQTAPDAAARQTEGAAAAPPPSMFAGVSINGAAPVAFVTAIQLQVGQEVEVDGGQKGEVKFVTPQQPPYPVTARVVRTTDGAPAVPLPSQQHHQQQPAPVANPGGAPPASVTVFAGIRFPDGSVVPFVAPFRVTQGVTVKVEDGRTGVVQFITTQVPPQGPVAAKVLSLVNSPEIGEGGAGGMPPPTGQAIPIAILNFPGGGSGQFLAPFRVNIGDTVFVEGRNDPCLVATFLPLQPTQPTPQLPRILRLAPPGQGAGVRSGSISNQQ